MTVNCYYCVTSIQELCACYEPNFVIFRQMDPAGEVAAGAVVVGQHGGGLLQNHGPFSWGKDADNAVYNAVVMEQVAKMAYISFTLNPWTTMNPLLVEKHFSRKHGPNAYYGQKKK